MKKVKVVVVGNCQSRPISSILENISSRVEVTAVVVVHLSKNEDYKNYEQHFKESNYIISQLVADNYPCDFVRTKFLKSNYGDKVISILNLYYRGYTPDWISIRHPVLGLLKGPMLDYHNLTILRNWQQGISIADTADLVENYTYNKLLYSDLAKSSLAQLAVREQEADVKIVEYIHSNFLLKRLFFTFNHPTNKLLFEYTLRIASFMNIAIEKDKPPFANEPLGQIIPKINAGLELTFEADEKHKGVIVNNVKYWEIELGTEKLYDTVELVNSFYALYDTNKQELEPLIGKLNLIQRG